MLIKNISAYTLPIIISFFFTNSKICAQQDFSKTEIKTTKVSDQVYMLEGSGGNIGVLVGESGTLMVDDQFAPLSDKIKAAIAKITQHKVDYVINTHHHHDHSGGNENFGGEAQIISHVNVRQRIIDYEKGEVESGKQTAVHPLAYPTLTFSDKMNLHLNGEDILLIYKEKAHTDGDIVVYFQNENVIHMGDVYVQYGWPFIDVFKGGNAFGMVNVIDHVLSVIKADTKVIPGHGNLATVAEMITFKEMIKTVTDRIRTQFKNGKTQTEIQEASETWVGFEEIPGNRKSFVEAVYMNLLSE